MPQFKVGEEVNVKHGKSSEMTLVIVQIDEVTCSAGKQTYYEGRVWQAGKSIGETSVDRVCLGRLIKFNEIELEKK